ncbi:hypothetical protein AAH450_06640 [Erwinia sp. P7711]|uniref:DUF7446 family protein n=1 Tax=Erwinia sp. P7711 TaxID=3141451 RepID=UPI00318EF301
MSIHNHTVFVSALTGEIYLARTSKAGSALDKCPATTEVVSAFTHHMMHGMAKGAEMSVQVGDGYYRLSCVSMTKEQFDADRASKVKP